MTPSVRPTARGVAVALVAVAAVVLAHLTGPRSLNAVAAPAVVALLAGAVQVALADPDVERTDPEAGFPGETRTVTVEVSGSGPAVVVDALPEGVEATDGEQRVTLPATVEYEVTLGDRGVWTLGPPRVAVTDVLGLFVRAVTSDATATLLVYPTVQEVRAEGPLATRLGGDRADERSAFDAVREYVPGDPLRDVHWRSSAKLETGDLVVKEFAGERTDSTVRLAASAGPGCADAMATAAASVADLALSAGLSVGLSCPAATVPPGRGPDHRERLLRVLARTDAGDPTDPAAERADVSVRADPGGVVVSVEGQGRPLAFADLSVDRRQGVAEA